MGEITAPNKMLTVPQELLIQADKVIE